MPVVDFFFNHYDHIIPATLMLAVVAAVVILFAEYKEKMWERIKHRRNKLGFSWMLISAAIIGFLAWKKYTSFLWIAVMVVIWIIYTISCLLSTLPKTNRYINPVLRYYKRKLNAGEILKHKAFFDKNSHWFLIDLDEKVEYQMLRASFLSSVSDMETAYKAYQAIPDKNIYPEEKRYIDLNKAYILAQMGAMSAALSLLGDAEANNSTDPFVWIAYAFVAENKGDVNAAFEYAEKAKSYTETSTKLSEWQKGQVYNDYARYLILKDAAPEQIIRYYQLAYDKVKSSDDIRLYQCVVSNLIIRKAIYGASREECEKILEEYRQKIKNQSLDNLLEFNNCQIALYRQLGDENKVYSLIKDGYQEIKKKTQNGQTEVFKASTFRMLINGQYVHDWFDSEVYSNIKEYKKLDLLDRLMVFKEYAGILSQKEYRNIASHEPYKKLYRNILDYYRRDAVREIDEYISHIESYNVFRYKQAVEFKLCMLKLVERNNHIKNSKQKYLDLIDYLNEAGLQIEAARIRLLLMDECASPFNVMVQMVFPYLMPPIYYSDFIERMLPPPPDPKVLPDKIHEEYFEFNPPVGFNTIPLQDGVIKENIDILAEELNSWKGHPVKIDMSVEIAWLYLMIDQKDKAKPFYEFFKKSGVSPAVFAPWFRVTIQNLQMEFEELDRDINNK